MVSRSGTTQSQQPLDLRMFESALRLFDDQINRSSYDANHWVRRGSFMREHGFPEIAVGDAFKAKLLLDREPANLEARKAVYEILGQALLGCHCHWEAAELWEEALKQYPRWGMAGEKATDLRELLRRKEAAAASLGGTPQEQKDRLKDGGVFTVNYRWTEFSWTPERSLTRSSKLVALINEELRGKDGETTCYLARSTLAADGNDDMLGMFASHEMQNGECILTDRTATGVCSTPAPNSCANCYASLPDTPQQAPCCSEAFCSPECLNLAMKTYHKALCGKDFTWLQRPTVGLSHNASPLRPLLMLRFLTTGVQNLTLRPPTHRAPATALQQTPHRRLHAHRIRRYPSQDPRAARRGHLRQPQLRHGCLTAHMDASGEQ
ncbi:hypothetical protein A1F94_002820 [Pyrenophora tritici-repentis]|uniref:DUF3984 domain containing protein n=1 Tax=Pyrenophora tritici-repentis TaxID=45151 RepID=A0A2W1DKU8_9PLEO|nr:hypothetical protein PtrV1_04031 [Pyrenophora tritici-repentis]KAF7451714.1 hypothetical protein A1F99_034910 [Pyrenophora tritici-repentis]KAF7575173.1 DUF3984 domain containing protein [Pyrenophora tritici-repentis]KAG9386070.1 hypothetical protein A1F94_002820 [Pyrenophora tritici-repentis]KAI0582965.1 hypothetical protein Alg215_03866 [Pyrenophora tritici-repentis]